MTLQYSDVVRNAKLDALETAIGTAAVLKIFAGTIPANVGTALSGQTVLATLTLPSDWMSAAAAGVKAKLGTWQDTAADATGTATWFAIFASDGTTRHVQGTAGTSGTDMILDSTSFTAGQAFSVTSFAITAGNA
jgi:hypothetical protein